MTALLIVLGVITAYFAIGVATLKAATPTMWRKARKNWGGSSYEDINQKFMKESVMAQTALWVPFWPIMILINHTTDALEQFADQTNPQRLQLEAEEREQKIAEQERRIAELERELGIGDR